MAQTSQFCTFYLDKLRFGAELKGAQEVIRSLHRTKVPPAVGKRTACGKHRPQIDLGDHSEE
jgi:hypothetical protein